MRHPIYFSGIDLGSTMTKTVIIDEAGAVKASIVGPTGAEHRRLANRVMESALGQAKISFDEIAYVVATGYGRLNVPFADRQITELTCHTRGVVSFFPEVRTAIDIGGQDAKGLKIRNGKLLDFVMNDRCAAGTGRYLEVVADSLGVKVEELGEISLKAKNKVSISSTCTVFAQNEVNARLAEGVPVGDIVASIHDAIAGRVVRMMGRLKPEPPVVFTGGVARNSGVVKALEAALGLPVVVPAEPLLTGALGAALLGREAYLKAKDKGETLPVKERRLEKATFFD